MPKVSVLIPYYNDKDYLAQCIQSVMNQSFIDFELILVNHATEDNCREIAHSFSDSRIHHMDLDRNNGAGGGIIVETFIKSARGQYLKLFCADDIMKVNCLEKLVQYLDSRPEKSVVFGDACFINKNSQRLNIKWSEYYKKFNFNDSDAEILHKYFHKNSFLPLPASMFRRTAVDGLFIDKSIIMEFDQSLWIQMLLNGCSIGFINDTIVQYRHHEHQVSAPKKAEFIHRYDFYESIYRARLFFKVQTLSHLSVILADFPLLQKLNDSDKEFFAFAVACYYLSAPECNDIYYRVVGYEYIHDCMENPVIREKLQEKFDFGIAQFRALYQNIEVNEIGIKGTFALLMKKIYAKIAQALKSNRA